MPTNIIAKNNFFDGTPAAPQAAPAGFRQHTHRRAWTTHHQRDAVWAWLDNPDTFVKAQVPPWRVEFVSAEPGVPPGFYVGGLNVHHGPGMLLAGTMTEIREGEYRDLQYFYGSHVFSLALVRPTRLQFWVQARPDGGTAVTMQLDSLVRNWFAPIWSLGNQVFWGSFGRWLDKLPQYT